MAIRVLHFVHWPKTGITSLLLSLFQANNRADVESYIFILDATDADATEFANWVGLSVTGGAGGYFAGVRRFLQMAKNISPDIIHTHSYLPSTIVALFLRSVPYVRTIHSSYPYFSDNSISARIKRHTERVAVDRVGSKVVCVSSGVKSALPYRLCRAALETIGNGVNIAKIVDLAGSRQQKVQMFDVPEDRVVVCSAGRLEHQKGYDVLLAAIATMPQMQRDKFLLVLIGDGSQRAALESMAENLQLGASVLFMGHQSNPYQFMRSADIYICSSRYEGHPIAIAEAMVVGLPIITTAVSGVPELVVDGVSGLIINELNPQVLAAVIVRLVSDAKLRRQLAAASNRRALASFSIASTAEAYLNLYRRVLDGN